MRALVLLNGELDYRFWQRIPELTGPFDCIICADGGGRHALHLQLRPHLLLGDFDSLSPAARQSLEADCVQAFPRDKDATDAELAVEAALSRGARQIVLAGAFGGRLDHALANLLLLRLIHRHGAAGVATDGRQVAYLVTPATGPLQLNGCRGLVSVLPISTGARDVTLTGLVWPLIAAQMEAGRTRGVSNECKETSATVAVGEGELLVIVTHEHIG